MYYDVEVPDFRSAPLSLSGLVVTAEPPVPAAPRDAFTGLLPIVPTVRRTFAATDTVQGFVRVYQARAGPLLSTTLTLRIVDGSDRTVFDLPRQVGSDQFTGDRSFDYLFDVPVARLESGPHLLRVDAVAGKATARRDVRFAIR